MTYKGLTFLYIDLQLDYLTKQ